MIFLNLFLIMLQMRAMKVTSVMTFGKLSLIITNLKIKLKKLKRWKESINTQKSP